jgi:hypothetical protein
MKEWVGRRETKAGSKSSKLLANSNIGGLDLGLGEFAIGKRQVPVLYSVSLCRARSCPLLNIPTANHISRPSGDAQRVIRLGSRR